MNKYYRGILIGMLLGDGCIKLKKPYKKQDGKYSVYAEFVIDHSIKQYAYLSHKCDKFHSIIGGKKPTICKQTHLLSNGKTYISYRFNRCNKYFKLLHRWAYSVNGKKTYTRKLLNMLNPEGISYWYQDDGGVKKTHNKNGYVSSVQTMLYTYCPGEEADIIITYFQEVYNITFRKQLHTKTQLYVLAANTAETHKFQNLVKKYIIPSMLYKIPQIISKETRAPNIPSG